MKLTYFQLEPHLNKTLSSVYLVSGDELFLKNEAINLIRKTAKRAGFHERIRLSPETGFAWEQLYPLLYSPSLLAEKRLLELDFRDTTPNNTASAILKEYSSQPSTDNVLLVDIGKVNDKIAKSAWYRSLEKIGIVITIWPIPHEQLPPWIIQRAKKYKLSLQQDAAQLLADYVEGNLIAAAQAIEKIYLLTHRKEEIQPSIDVEIVQSILADESRFTIFDFTDSLIASDPSRTLHILESLRLDGTEPILILWSITRELRLMATLSQEIKQGEKHELLFQKHRIFSRRQAAVRCFLNRYNTFDCWHALLKTAEIDRLIKGATAGNIWNNLQLFCLRFL